MVPVSDESYLADTHAFIWHLSKSSALGREAFQAFAQVVAGQARIAVSAISLVEAVYLFERRRISLGFLDEIFSTLEGTRNYSLLPVDRAVVDSLRRIDSAQVREMPDRIIAATALADNIPLITKDERLRSCEGIRTVW